MWNRIIAGGIAVLVLVPLLLSQSASVTGAWHGLLLTPVGDIELNLKLERTAQVHAKSLGLAKLNLGRQELTQI